MANANLACQGQISLSLYIYICIYVVQMHAWGILGDNNIGEPTSAMRYVAPSGDGQFPLYPKNGADLAAGGAKATDKIL